MVRPEPLLSDVTGSYFGAYARKNIHGIIIESILESFASMLPLHTRDYRDVCSRL
jgi:hypothetical protein